MPGERVEPIPATSNKCLEILAGCVSSLLLPQVGGPTAAALFPCAVVDGVGGVVNSSSKP